MLYNRGTKNSILEERYLAKEKSSQQNNASSLILTGRVAFSGNTDLRQSIWTKYLSGWTKPRLFFNFIFGADEA